MKSKNTHITYNPVEKRKNTKSIKDRQQTQKEINKLKELYEKLYFAHNYPKDTTKLLTRSCESLETHLIKQGLPEHRVEELFNQTLEATHKNLQDSKYD
jgi:chorismate mutase